MDWLSGMMNRRDFLKATGLGGLVIGLGSTAYRVLGWWNQPAGSGYGVLSRDEVEILEAVADAMFPGEEYQEGGMPNGVEAGVVAHVDSYLAAIDGQVSRLLRMLVHLIDSHAAISDFRLRRFRDRPRDERIAILKAWDNSSILARRKGFRGLKLVLAGGYCTHPDVLGASGIRFRCGGG